MEIAPGDLPERGDEVEQESVRAIFEEAAMPDIVQLHDPGHVPAHLLELPGQVGERVELLRGELGDEPQGEGLKDGEDPADVPQLLAGERSEPESSSGLEVQDSLARQAQEGLPDGCPADAKLLRQCRVSDPGSWRYVPTVDASDDLVVDLLAERHS